jgi:hypothetical protein
LIEHDLRANASRLSRGKPLHAPDQVEGMLFRIMSWRSTDSLESSSRSLVERCA